VAQQWDQDHAGRTAVLQNVRGLVDFLRRHSPFDQMDEPDLVYLVEHSRLASWRRRSAG
jgi:hypothetical protein